MHPFWGVHTVLETRRRHVCILLKPHVIINAGRRTKNLLSWDATCCESSIFCSCLYVLYTSTATPVRNTFNWSRCVIYFTSCCAGFLKPVIWVCMFGWLLFLLLKCHLQRDQRLQVFLYSELYWLSAFYKTVTFYCGSVYEPRIKGKPVRIRSVAPCTIQETGEFTSFLTRKSCGLPTKNFRGCF